MSSDMIDIIKSAIEAIGTIVAAVLAAIIAAKGAGKIVKENKKSQFHTYSDKDHEVRDILTLAQHDIFIVAMIGNVFLTEYVSYLEKLLKKGISIEILVLSEERLREAEDYINKDGIQIDIGFRKDILRKLEELETKYHGLFEWREFDLLMTASYICIDAVRVPYKRRYIPSSIIQTMIYQYRTEASNMLITYVSPEDPVFDTTVKCLQKMWEDSRKVSAIGKENEHYVNNKILELK